MSNITPTLRPGMTAIAALMALSSTPLLAQATDSAASQSAAIAAPVIVAAPETAPVLQSSVDATATPDAATPAPVEAATVMRTVGTPVIHTEAAESDAQVAPQPRAANPSASISTARTARASKVTPVKSQVISSSHTASAPASRAAVPSAAAAPSAAPAPSVVKTSTETGTVATPSIDNEAIPAAGLVGLGALAIGGLAFAFRRKRRRNEDEELSYEPTLVAAAPIVSAEPVAVRTGTRMRAKPPVMANSFDLSRYGPHVQAAYAGPTADNPFLSLKRRLHRARFYDQREREAAAIDTAVEAPRSRPVPARAAAKAKSDERQVTVSLAPKRKAGRFGFAFAK